MDFIIFYFIIIPGKQCPSLMGTVVVFFILSFLNLY